MVTLIIICLIIGAIVASGDNNKSIIGESFKALGAFLGMFGCLGLIIIVFVLFICLILL